MPGSDHAPTPSTSRRPHCTPPHTGKTGSAEARRMLFGLYSVRGCRLRLLCVVCVSLLVPEDEVLQAAGQARSTRHQVRAPLPLVLLALTHGHRLRLRATPRTIKQPRAQETACPLEAPLTWSCNICY